MSKLKIGVVFGGRSAEHEVSLMSANNIIDALDKSKYEPVLIFISKTGEWFLRDSLQAKTGEKIALVPASGEIVDLDSAHFKLKLDVVFPVLHGPFGEDGTVQGLLKILDVPFVGPGVLSSAAGMDKDVANRLLSEAGIPVAKFLVAYPHQKPNYQDVVKDLGEPFFVKPANMGSSVGVSKVSNQKEFDRALKDAFTYDQKIVIEQNLDGREIECSILGNEHPQASVLGEVIPSHEFYSYQAKYIDPNGAALKIPAELVASVAGKVQELAIKTFKTLNCQGMARVDFFVKANGDIFVGEINTIPGFTAISMYPKLWEASGVPYDKLIDQLIQLAIERFNQEQSLKTSYV